MAGTSEDEEVRHSMSRGPLPVQSSARLRSRVFRCAGSPSAVVRRRPAREPGGVTSGADAGVPSSAGAFCVDGPMAGEELTVRLDGDGLPPSVIDVAGHGYLLMVQPRPVIERPWQYTVIRQGDLWLVDGGVAPDDGGSGRRDDGGG